MTASWSQRKMGSKAIANKKPFAGQPCLTSGHEEWSSLFCKFHMCSTVAVDPSQETGNELRQLCLLEHTENPGVIDAGRQNQSIGHLILVERTQHVPRQLFQFRKCYPSFALKRYISEMDVYISWCTSEGLGKSPW